MTERVQKYVTDIAIQTDILLFDRMDSEISRYDIDKVSIGSDSLIDIHRFEFIQKLLQEHEDVVYFTNGDANRNLSNLIELFSDRIEIVNDNDLVYAAKVDMFIHFESDYKIDKLRERKKCFIAASPLNISMNKTKDVLESIFAVRAPFVFKILFEYFGQKELVKPIDILYQSYSDVLSVDDIEYLYKSEVENMALFSLYIKLAIKNKAFRDRFKDIGYLQLKFTLHDTLSSSPKILGSKSFIQTVD